MFIHSIKVGTALGSGIHYFNRELLQMLIESQSGTDGTRTRNLTRDRRVL